MAALTTPRARRSLIGQALGAVQARARSGRSDTLTRLAALARQHVVTTAALASIDLGAFRASDVAGWIVTGVSLLVLDFAVTG